MKLVRRDDLGCPLPHAPFCLDTRASATSFAALASARFSTAFHFGRCRFSGIRDLLGGHSLVLEVWEIFVFFFGLGLWC